MRSTPPRRPRWPFSLTRTSYQVGRPWMFDGKMLRGLTGTPMRRIALANSSFADAEPEPLTLANLTTKSLTAAIGFIRHFPSEPVVRESLRPFPHPALRASLSRKRARGKVVRSARQSAVPPLPLAGEGWGEGDLA